MEKLKEYAGVIVAVVTVMTALATLGLWAIHMQINPEIRRLDGHVESVYREITGRMDRMEDRFETRFNRIERDIKTIRGDVNTIRDDVKTILLRLPKQPQTG